MEQVVLGKHLSNYLTSLVPICCRISCLSSSDVRCKMFLSSSSFLDGLLPSLIARVSLRRILLAKAPEDLKRAEMERKQLLGSGSWVTRGINLYRAQIKFFILMQEKQLN